MIPVKLDSLSLESAATKLEPTALFQNILLPRRSAWRSFAASIASHAGVVYLGTAYAAFVAAHPMPPAKPNLTQARILELDMRNLRPYIPRPPDEPVPPTRDPGVHPKLPAPRVEKPPEEPPKPEPPAPAPRVVRKFQGAAVEVANSVKVPVAKDTLIQLDIPNIDVQSQLQVPKSLVLTNSPVRKLPRPFIRPPDLPAREIPAAAVLELEAPRIQAATGDVPISLKNTVEKAALTAIPASKAPVAGVAPKPAEAAIGNWKAEEAPTLVALPDTPIPPHAAVVVPPTVQTAGSGGTTSVQAGVGSRAGTSVAAPEVAANGNSADPRAGGASSAPAAPRPAAVLPAVTRITLARDGKYEVVVAQNAGIIPGSAEFLSGRPVYSVYVHAGDRKDWILQYCLPAGAQPQKQTRTVIQLGPSSPLAAPFAYVMMRPPVNFRHETKYALLHGTINTEGRFEQLTEVGDPVIGNLKDLLDALNGWEFRPATKDGVPTAVEILLCIPYIAI